MNLTPLLARAAAVSRHASACGALQTARTRSEIIEEAGIRFLVHVLMDGWDKTSAFSPIHDRTGSSISEDEAEREEEETPPTDPFLPYDPDLFVAAMPTGHICLLNKYNVLSNHLLLVTPEFVEQESPLDLADFAAFWFCLREFDGLAFYNSGQAAGASQRHKHLQVAPLPFEPFAPFPPVEAVLADLRVEQGVGYASALPFVHAIAQLDLTWRGERETGPAYLFEIYQILLERIGCARASSQPAPYNLLLTRRWMMATPRTRPSFGGVPINALGYAGSFLAKNEQHLSFLRSVGPLTVLRNASVSKDAL